MYSKHDPSIACAACGEETWQESVDVGVGVIYGPAGCPNCGWSEDPDYDLSTSDGIKEDGSAVDQFGGIYPKDSMEAKARRDVALDEFTDSEMKHIEEGVESYALDEFTDSEMRVMK